MSELIGDPQKRVDLAPDGARYVRGLHPAMFRSGEWAELVVRYPARNGSDLRPQWLVRFPDGFTDVWAAWDRMARYEFSAEDPDVS